MEDTSFLNKMFLQLRSTCKSYYTQHLDRMLEEAAVEFYPTIKFMRIECPKYPGFCITRQKSVYPFIEIFHSPKQ
ncbi:unnamed protein product, partial [Thlaspi arvense]